MSLCQFSPCTLIHASGRCPTSPFVADALRDTQRRARRMRDLRHALFAVPSPGRHQRGLRRRLQSRVALRVETVMLYPELFKQLEAVRWNMDRDIPWDRFDASL